jgi:hypothetical protein
MNLSTFCCAKAAVPAAISATAINQREWRVMERLQVLMDGGGESGEVILTLVPKG